MKKNTKTQSIINVIPIILIIAVLPFVMNLYSYDNHLSSYAWMAETGDSIDLFLHGKMVFFEGSLLLAVGILLYALYQKKVQVKFPPIFCLLLIYLICSIASTICSPYRAFGFTGIYEQFENLWCLIGYVFIIFYIYYMINEHRQLDILLHILLIASLIMGLIGTGQFLGFDFITTNLAKMLYTPGGYDTLELALAFGKGIVYITLYNPDYVGLYTSLVCPVMAVLVIYHKNKVIKTLAVLSMVFLTISTIGAQVASGYIGLAVTAMVFVVFLLRQICYSRKTILLTLISIWGILALVCVISQVSKQLNMRWQTETELATSDSNTSSVSGVDNTQSNDSILQPESYKLEKIVETDEYVEFNYNNIVFRESMRIENGMVYLDFVDENGEPIAYDYDPASMNYTLTEDGLTGITSITANLIDKYIGFITTIDGKSWAFTLATKDDVVSYYTFNSLGHLDKNIDSQSAIFTGHYSLFNGRGYIWAKTIPLLKKYILLGSGADSFTLVFPQSDYLDAYKGGYENMIISKPHCAYLQIAVQTGVLSLIVLLIFYIWYTIKCLKLYFWRKTISFEQALAISIFAGTVGFMVICIANDSTICVTPVFAAFIGLGIVLNRMNEEK